MLRMGPRASMDQAKVDNGQEQGVANDQQSILKIKETSNHKNEGQAKNSMKFNT